MITWTEEMLARFKEAHWNAVERSKKTFMFDKHEFDVAYAGYLIQYLQQEFEK